MKQVLPADKAVLAMMAMAIMPSMAEAQDSDIQQTLANPISGPTPQKLVRLSNAPSAVSDLVLKRKPSETFRILR